ncbi:phage tail tube protein [Thauera propionica]|jgi:hypothetical protein|uniref:phage tail tube protein n=1 Tax=Thauera propionica TaxID=2019431 RepID=UPI0023F15D26|nr:phage tail tube protein [Thauera propionica]MDD3675806.1 hypothetical protein [Thauera propionica]
MAGGLLMRNTAVLAKIETTYGTDAAPAGATDAILVSDVTARPMDMQTVDRALLRPFLGNSEQLPTQIYNGVEFSVELAGSGTAGTAPPIGKLLRGCGFAETVTPSTSVVYAPVSTGFESLTLHVNIDGVLHKSTGARGTVSFSFKNNDRPMARFNFTGLFVPVVDAALPAVTLTAWKKPLPCNRSNTPTFNLHGYAAMLDDLQIDMANSVVYRGLIGGAEYVRITDRKPAGSVLMEAVKVADKDWWTSIQGAANGALEMVHGLTGGNIVEVDAPGVQLYNPSYQEQDGILMLSAQMSVNPGASGNDELVLTFR